MLSVTEYGNTDDLFGPQVWLKPGSYAVTASLIMIPTMTAMTTIAGAEETAAAADDLAMPSEAEAIKADVSLF